MKNKVMVLVIVVLAGATAAPAGIVGIDGDTSAPAATLGSYTMTPFAADGRGLVDVTAVSSPLGDVLFNRAMGHRRIGMGWGTWSHGYTGDVYYSLGATAVTLTLPNHTGAFYFYAEPNPWEVWTISATAQDGTIVSQGVDGYAGASYFGFYGTEGSLLSSIAITGATDFAVGEFGIAYGEGGPAVPAPGAILLGTFGTGLVGWLRRRRAM